MYLLHFSQQCYYLLLHKLIQQYKGNKAPLPRPPRKCRLFAPLSSGADNWRELRIHYLPDFMHWTASSADTHFGSRSNTCDTSGVYVKYVFGPTRPVSEFHILARSPILFTAETDIGGGARGRVNGTAEGWWEDNQNDEPRGRFCNLYSRTNIWW